jgi:hypothetical protein
MYAVRSLAKGLNSLKQSKVYFQYKRASFSTSTSCER